MRHQMLGLEMFGRAGYEVGKMEFGQVDIFERGQSRVCCMRAGIREALCQLVLYWSKGGLSAAMYGLLPDTSGEHATQTLSPGRIQKPSAVCDDPTKQVEPHSEQSSL